MSDLGVALGLVLVLEGLLWALSPGTGRSLLDVASRMPDDELRRAGWLAVGLGLVIVWMVRG